ncbi:hypothetical protein T07_14464 [Trichinella nelsoni]|uniref:Uncharacterized protein n=1 Tax=Trichinella nelsoni TaxID=6336 RepID=A0A0V0S4S4_9BILA|nr:hypothetical protein T07_14464 [Trichinella nelsoni]
MLVNVQTSSTRVCEELNVQQFCILIIVVGELTALTWNSVGNKQAVGNTKVDQQQRILHLTPTIGSLLLLTCTWMKGTIFIQKQEQPVISILISLLREGIIETLCKCCKGKIEVKNHIYHSNLGVDFDFYHFPTNQHLDAIWTTGLKDETEKLEFR